jgi:hypothetical protein
MLLKRAGLNGLFRINCDIRQSVKGLYATVGCSFQGFLTQEPVEVILRGIVAIRWQTDRARALAGEACVHLPAHVGVVVAIVVARQVCGVCEGPAAGGIAG